DNGFPIYGFCQIGSRRDPSMSKKRWAFLGLLQFLRSYRERQVDSRGQWRNAWVFEFRVHSEPAVIHRVTDRLQMAEILANCSATLNSEDREVMAPHTSKEEKDRFDLVTLEPIRRQLLAYSPVQFEHVICDLLQQSGFEEVQVTKYSQDGGIDVNARPGKQ